MFFFILICNYIGAVANIASYKFFDAEYAIRLVKMGCIKSFMKLLQNTDDTKTTNQLLWGLGNIAGSCPRLRDEILNTDVLQWILKNLINFPIRLKRNAVWALTNFCRGKPSPNWEIVRQILTPLSELIKETRDHDVILDSLWTIAFLIEDRSANGSNKHEEVYRKYYDSDTKLIFFKIVKPNFSFFWVF